MTKSELTNVNNALVTLMEQRSTVHMDANTDGEIIDQAWKAIEREFKRRWPDEYIAAVLAREREAVRVQAQP